VSEASVVTTVLFTDIEGSTLLWEQDRERMSAALAVHDALARTAVEHHGGLVVKMTSPVGDSYIERDSMIRSNS
jgi:class 3 adenylate cyclase